MKDTLCISDENLEDWKESKLAWEKKFKLEEREDKKTERTFFPKMKQMKLLKQDIFVLFLKK